MKLSIVSLACLFSLVNAHAVITSPKPRAVGTNSETACGAAVNKVLKGDIRAPIEFAVAKIDSAYSASKCKLFLCRGLQLADNLSNVQSYTPGQVVPIHVDIAAHHTGYANVSVVNLVTQTAIGAPLRTWPVYADDKLGPADWPPTDTDFTVTIPTTLGTACKTAGACAIQWYWYAPGNKQTYESCVDFVTP